MVLSEFFLNAMLDNAWHNPMWVKSVFCLRREPPDKWTTDKYPYRIVQQADGYYFLNKDLVLTKFKDAPDLSRPLLNVRERVTVPANTVINWPSGGDTDVGILLANFILLIGVFGTRIPYINGHIKIKAIENNYIVKHRADFPNGDRNNFKDRDPTKFYIDDLENFGRAVDYIENFNDYFVPGGSQKMMTVHPDFFAYREALAKEYEGKLNNPIEAADFVNKLLKWDFDNWLKGDPGLGYLKVSSKSLKINRSRVLLTFGGENTLGKSDGINFVVKSLLEGWDIDNLDIYFNAQRFGSYSRGAETVLGGVVIKEMTTLSAHAKITYDDCGSAFGVPVAITGENFSNYVGTYYVDAKNKKAVRINEEDKEKIVGNKLSIRNPKYCHGPHNSGVDFCAKCCGDKLAAKPKALGVAVNTIGQIFLEVYMGAAHIKELQSAKLDIDKIFGMYYY